MSEEKKTDDLVTMKKEEFEKVINAKVEEVAKSSKADAEAMKKEMTAEFEEKLKVDLEKATASRKTIEDTGLDCFGNDVSDEARVVAKLEKSHGDCTDYEKELQKAHDQLAIVNYIFKREERDVKQTKSYKRYQELAKKGNFLKAGYDGTSGDGLEWQPTILSNRLVEYVEASGDFAIANQFQRINMESKIFEIPREESAVTAYLGSVGGSPTESHAASGKATFTAKKIIAHTNVYYEAEEDMIISAIPLIESRLVKGVSKGVSDAIINGDTDATHMDASVTSATDRRKAWDGLRKVAQDLSWTDSIGAVWTDALLRGFEGNIATEFYEAMNDLLFILPKNSYHQLRGLGEVRTMDKYGSMATINNGRLEKIDGVDVILTSLLALTDSSGTVSPTTANNTKDQALFVYKPAYALGMRRSMLLETDKNILTQNIDVVASLRADFQSLIKASSSSDQQSVVQAINVTTA